MTTPRTAPRFMTPFVVTVVLAVPAWAQSTITLDSFDLRRPPPVAAQPAPAAAPTGRASCLFAAEGCSAAQGAGRPFSLDDVVNLGIVDRREVAVPEAGDPSAAARMAAPLPSIDLEVLFEYGSDQLRADQIAGLYALALELRGVDFSRRRLILLGHTDAAGSAALNRDLSLRRAITVAEFLAREAGIPRDRIRTAGMGFDYLKYPNDPLNGANRRVQILLVEG